MPKYKPFVSWIEKKVAEYQSVLNLQAYRIHVCQSPSKTKNGSFETENRWPYQRVYLDWGLDNFAQFQKKEFHFLEQSILHELCHTVLMRLDVAAQKRHITEDEIDDAVEATADHIAIVIYMLMNKSTIKRKSTGPKKKAVSRKAKAAATRKKMG